MTAYVRFITSGLGVMNLAQQLGSQQRLVSPSLLPPPAPQAVVVAILLTAKLHGSPAHLPLVLQKLSAFLPEMAALSLEKGSCVGYA